MTYAATSVQPINTSPPQTSRLRLDYLDGMRGLAALYVVVYHASNWVEVRLPGKLVFIQKLLTYGHFAVAVFIILSGYCLMLPVARSADQQLRGGFKEYIRRRARRILPPYYAALLLSLLFIKVVPAMDMPSKNYWGGSDGALPALTWDAIVSHLLLVHNLSNAWHFKIDPPLWSVATEWQIYFFFPLVLLPLWRRFGLLASVLVGIALGLAPHFLLHAPYNLAAAVPWYLGLFAMGMAAAAISFEQKEVRPQIGSDAQPAQPLPLRQRLPWHIVAGVLFLLTALLAILKAKWWWNNLWISDTLVGFCTATLLIYCTEAARNHQPGTRLSPVLQFFQARWSVFLGTMSYSLYLLHAPLLALFYYGLSALNVSAGRCLLALCFAGVPLSVLLCYGFHLVFERPFMSHSGDKPAARPDKSVATVAP